MLRRLRADVAVFAVYLTISVSYVGWRILVHPGRLLIGGSTRDPEIFIWSFAWWPHAIAHWMNPFYTHVLYTPTGINMTWTASAPGLALAFSPVTLLFGPAVAYNVVALLLPALSAWTAYLLCRKLTGSIWASLVGGFLFGFSSGILQEELWGNLHVTAAFLLPLVALVLVQYVQGDLSGRGLAWRLGVLIAAQLWISTELALTLTLVLAVSLLLAYWLIHDLRPRLRSALRPIGVGYALGALLAAPIVVYALFDIPPGRLGNAPADGSDLLNLVVPGPMVAIGGSTLSSVSSRFHEGSAYLGLPTLLIVGVFAFGARRSGVARFLVAVFLACALAALGTAMHVDGRKVIALPWLLTAHLPGFEDMLPFRFSIYASLVAAIIVALWTARSKGRIYPRPFLLPALAVAALVPAVWQSSFHAQALWRPDRWAFFTQGLYKTCLPPNETVAVFPFGFNGDSLLWQAETGFRFRMAGDALGPVTLGQQAWTSFDADWVVTALNSSEVGQPSMDSLLAFVANHHVDRVISVASGGYPSAAQMASFGPVERLGGVLIAPACGQPSLAKRDLTSFVQQYEQQRESQASIDYCLGSNLDSLPAGLDPSGPLKGATPALFVSGQGITCVAPPAGYTRHGFATADQGVPADTYPLYSR